MSLPIKSLADAFALARREFPSGLICFCPDEGWCGHVHGSVTDAQLCRSRAAGFRTYSICSDPASVIDDGAERLAGVFAYLDARDTVERCEGSEA